MTSTWKKYRTNTVLYCPSCGIINPDKQKITWIQRGHAILNCGICKRQKVIMEYSPERREFERPNVTGPFVGNKVAV